METRETHTLSLKLDSNSGQAIVPMPALPTITAAEGITKLSEAVEMVNFKAYSRIMSIPISPIPEYELEDSETDRLIKTLDVEWKSPRKQLNIYVGNPDNWFLIGSVSLLNTNGYPYRIYDLLQIYNGSTSGFIGSDKRMGLQIQNVGNGLLEYDDVVSITLDVVRYVSYFIPTTIVNNIINTNIPEGNTDNSGNDGGGDNGNNDDGDDEMPITVITVNTTLQNRDRVLCNNTSNITVTFPASPSDGWEVEVIKLNDSGEVRFLGNGATIKGYSDSIEPGIASTHKGGRFVYFNGDWREHPAIGATITLFNF